MPTDPFDQLVTVLAKLPGLGRRTAERMALRLLRDKDTLLKNLVDALEQASQNLATCSLCGSLTPDDHNPCRLCTDPRRDDRVLCVVEEPSDILLLEKSGAFRGRYHALMGKLSPMRGTGVGDLRLEVLRKRLKQGDFDEVVLALNTDVESEATSQYLAQSLSSDGIKISRIAYGLPAGSGLAYSDPETLTRAMQGRVGV